MKKLAAIAVSAVMALCLAGCSSESKQDAEVIEEPVIEPLSVESGFGDSQYGTNVGVVITNPNESLAYRSVALVITVKDADGNVVAADPEFKIGDMMPGETFGLGILMGDGGNAASVTVSTSDSGTFESAPVSTLKVENFNIDSYSIARGEVANSGEKVNDLLMGVVLRDADGKIIGGGYDDLMNVGEGATFPFEIYTFDETNRVAEAEVYAHIYW